MRIISTSHVFTKLSQIQYVIITNSPICKEMVRLPSNINMINSFDMKMCLITKFKSFKQNYEIIKIR